MNRRRTEILNATASSGEVTVAELAKRFGVTAMTIRRDLDDLAGAGKVVRTHGGAMLSRRSVVEFEFSQKGQLHIEEKRAIGECITSDLIKDGNTVILDTGTTTLEVARNLVATPKRLTVLTTSLAIASILYSYETIEVVLLGGTMRRQSPDLSGALTEENLKRFKVDVAVLGADAVSRDGAYTDDIGVARCSRAIIESAKIRVLAVDASKFDARALFKYADWKDIQNVVTVKAARAKAGKWLDRSVDRVKYI